MEELRIYLRQGERGRRRWRWLAYLRDRFQGMGRISGANEAQLIFEDARTFFERPVRIIDESGQGWYAPPREFDTD